jgi:DNA (cytosine-5)-methyltransferase 1
MRSTQFVHCSSDGFVALSDPQVDFSMAVKRYNLVSLFTGAGGLDIGLEQAGLRTVSAVDSDPDCVRTLLDNQAAKICHGDGQAYLEGATILQAGIEALGPADLRPSTADADWVPDLLAGGPPCQPFSSSGKMLSVSDPRGRLFEDFVQMAKGLKPKLILFENVRGLVTARGPKGEPGEVLRAVRQAFEDIGYATTFALLNAADYGCPQRRVRCFMMATSCTYLPEFPGATHGEFPQTDLFGTSARWVTLGEYLAALPPPSNEETVRPTERLAAKLADVVAGSGLKSAGARETTRPGGHWGYRQGTFIADLTQPARTITASASQDWVRLADGTLRRLTLRECAGLQGFPPDWQFAGPVASKFRQVGNAVPSVFGRVLGEALIEALEGGRRSKPKSATLPREFEAAIAYTRREQARNGESRRSVRDKLGQPGIDLGTVKGLGSAGLACE